MALMFGMMNSLVTCRRAMNFIAAGLSNVVTYIDDMVLGKSSWREHIQHFRALFEKLLSLPKCDITRVGLVRGLWLQGMLR